MKQAYGFTEFENIQEFKQWLDKQHPTRKITKLQVHHMYAPSYANWKTDNALRRQYNTEYNNRNYLILECFLLIYIFLFMIVFYIDKSLM